MPTRRPGQLHPDPRQRRCGRLYNNGTVDVTDNGTNDSAPAMGVITVDPLDAGSWKLVETGAPTGWLKDTDAVLFTVPDAQGHRNVTLANPTLSDPRKTYPVSVRKVSKADNSVRIEGAMFDLFKVVAGGDVKVGSCTTAADGECTVPNMAWGESYYWVETFVPAPYNLPSQPKSDTFTLNADGSTTPSGITVFEDTADQDRDPGDERLDAERHHLRHRHGRPASTAAPTAR